MKVHLSTFGCRANHYDSETVRALVIAAGHEIVDDASRADIAVFNSCAVTAEAERDVRKAIRRAASTNPKLRSIVMGCAAALPESQRTLRALDSVEQVIGGANIDEIGAALGVHNPERHAIRQSTVRAVLRIQDGCDEHCTFCATTLARGVNRSRAIEDLIDEAGQLSAQHPEIVITGTHIGAYGTDSGSSLGVLLQQLIRSVPDVRFRLSSLEATEVDERLAELFVSEPARLAPHLHAPLQSGSDLLLKRMGRHWYTAESYARSIEALAARLTVFGLGADVIVGFPGETDAHFAATVSLVERLPFTYLHVFTYSPRPGTAALRLPAQVPPAAAQERSRALRQLAQTKANAYKRSRATTVADAVVISGAPDRQVLTEDYLTLRAVGPPRRRGERYSTRLRRDGDSLVAT